MTGVQTCALPILYTIYTSEGRVKDVLMYQNQPIDVDIDPAHLDKLSTAINLYIQREGNSFHVTGNTMRQMSNHKRHIQLTKPSTNFQQP